MEDQDERGSAIVAAVTAVLSGQQEPGILLEVAQHVRIEILSLLDEVRSMVAGLDRHVQEAVSPCLDRIDEAVSSFEAGFEGLENYTASGERPSLTRSAEILRRAGAHLERALSDLRTAALVAMGPTDMPDFNQVHGLMLRAREFPTEESAALVEGVEDLLLKACRSIKMAREQPPSQDRDAIVEAYRHHLEACEELMGHVHNRRHDSVEASLARVADAMSAIREMIPHMQVQIRSAIPTRSPRVNFLVHLMAELAAGNVTDIAVRDALAQVESALEAARKPFRGLARDPERAKGLHEEGARVLEAMVLQEAALVDLVRFFDSRDLALLEGSRTRLIVATEQLEDAHNAFLQAADREGCVSCPHCGDFNGLDRRDCGECGSPLVGCDARGTSGAFDFVESPGASAAGGDGDIPLGEHVGRLFEAVNLVAEGTISREQFRGEVVRFENLVDHHSCVPGVEVPPDYDRLPLEEREACEARLRAGFQAEEEFRNGVLQFRTGLQHYRAFLDDGSPHHLVDGTPHLWEGNVKMYALCQATGVR